MKKQLNEIKRMQLLAGLITESEYRESLNEEETIFADYSTNNDNSIKTKLARNLAEEIHSLDVKEGTIDSLFTGEMEQYAEGNDDFYANKEEALKAFAELPDTFTIMHNIDGNKVKISITKTGPKSWKVNEMDEAEAPLDIKDFLLGMMDSFADGNDNDYPAGEHMEFKYEEEMGDEDLYDEKTAMLFNKAKMFLSKNGPVTLQDTFAGQPLDLTFSTDGEDIKMEWIEPAINNKLKP